MESDMTSTSTYISIDDAALRLRVHSKTVRKWVAAGHVPAYRLGPKVLRIKLADLEAMVERKRVPTAGS